MRYFIEPATRNPEIDAFTIVDRDASLYHLPRLAVHLRMRKTAATQVAAIMNVEWSEFVRNPS